MVERQTQQDRFLRNAVPAEFNHCSQNASICIISGGSLVSMAISGKIKANPGLDRIWNLIMGPVYFEGAWAAQMAQEIFAEDKMVRSDLK